VDIFWELQQNKRLDQAESAEAKAKRRAIDLELRCDQLEEQISNLRIFVQALVDLTWDQFDVSEEQLQSRIHELKEEKKREETDSGIKPKKVSFPCPNCGQPVAMSSKVCFYCGKPACPPDQEKEPS